MGVKGLAAFGGLTLIAIFVFMVSCLFTIIGDYITRAICSYKYKHRFNKKPIAKCYCRDCKKWNPETGECGDSCNSRYMGETWFCCFAEPADAEEIKRRDKEKNNE